MKQRKTGIRVAIGVAVFSAALLLFQFFYIGIVLKSEAEQHSEEIASQMAQKIARSVELYFRDALTVTQTYSSNFLVYKQAKLPRSTVYSLMQGSLALNEKFLSIWTMWEPNAYDNNDAYYRNDGIHDPTGSFSIGYYYEGQDIKLEVNDTIDFYADYYTLVEKYKQSVIVDPYYYKYHGNPKLYFETSMVSPIIESNKFLGVIAIDIDMYALQNMFNKTRVEGDGFLCLLSNSGVIVTHKFPEYIEKNLLDYLGNEKMAVSDSIKSGKEITTESHSLFSNETAVRYYYPINMDYMAEPWYVMIEIPKRKILEQANSLKNVSSVLLLASLILLFYLFYNIADQSRREKKLLNTLHKVEQSEAHVKESEERARRQRSAIAALALDKSLVDDDLQSAFCTITRILSETVQVERASIWMLNNNSSELKCMSLFEASQKKHSSGLILKAGDYPAYFKAILEESRIYARNAQTDPRTSEFSQSYLIPLGITSMLDAGITQGNKLIGVVCIEHTGKQRNWNPDEESFTTAVASLIAQNIANHNRKLAEDFLRESEEKYRYLLENMNEVLIMVDNDDRVLFVNKRFTELLGYTLEEIIGEISYEKLLDPTDHELIIEENKKRIKKESGQYEISFKAKDGRKIDFLVGGCPMIDSEGKTFGSIGTMTDITERKKAERELEKYQNHLELLVSKRTDELSVMNEELQSSNEELYTQRDNLEEALTNLQETQRRLIQSEKMASLGILSAGIAHEINNPLNFIHGGSQFIENYIKNNFPQKFEEVKPVIDGINTGVKRATEIVRSLNQYSRSDTLPFSNCNINSILDDCLVMLHNQFKNRIEVQKQYSEEHYVFKGNEGKLHQAFLNILANAGQSIIDKGKVTIHSTILKNEIHIEIADSGQGISAENLEKIFDPFFTTKEPGKGTGLGLSITYSIIQEHKGTLNYESQPGKGTIATIKFPVQKNGL